MPRKTRFADCHTDRKHQANGLCRSCYGKDLYYKNVGKSRERAVVRTRTYRAKRSVGEREQDLAKKRQWAKLNWRERELATRYGLTVTDVERMRNEQSDLCAICREAPAEFVDHNHTTGEVRGLLCLKCNSGLGFFRDDERILLLAQQYLSLKGSSPAPAKPATNRRARTEVVQLSLLKGGRN